MVAAATGNSAAVLAPNNNAGGNNPATATLHVHVSRPTSPHGHNPNAANASGRTSPKTGTHALRASGGSFSASGLRGAPSSSGGSGMLNSSRTRRSSVETPDVDVEVSAAVSASTVGSTPASVLHSLRGQDSQMGSGKRSSGSIAASANSRGSGSNAQLTKLVQDINTNSKANNLNATANSLVSLFSPVANASTSNNSSLTASGNAGASHAGATGGSSSSSGSGYALPMDIQMHLRPMFASPTTDPTHAHSNVSHNIAFSGHSSSELDGISTALLMSTPLIAAHSTAAAGGRKGVANSNVNVNAGAVGTTPQFASGRLYLSPAERNALPVPLSKLQKNLAEIMQGAGSAGGNA